MSTTIAGTSAFYQRSAQQMSALTLQTQTMQTQISTGSKLSAASDDPLAAGKLRTMQRADTTAAVGTANASTATDTLNTVDSTLSSFTNLIDQAKTLAQQAANGTMSASQRQSSGATMLQLYDQMVSLANTRDASGNALFGGTGTGDAYTTDASGQAVYSGSGSPQTLDLGGGHTVTSSITGPDFLNFSVNGTQTDLLTQVQKLGQSLSTGSTSSQTDAQNSLSMFDTAGNTVDTQQAIVGARLNWIDTATSQNSAMAETRSTDETSLGSTDMTTTIANLQNTMTVLEASQSAFAKLASLSLFDKIS